MVAFALLIKIPCSSYLHKKNSYMRDIKRRIFSKIVHRFKKIYVDNIWISAHIIFLLSSEYWQKTVKFLASDYQMVFLILIFRLFAKIFNYFSWVSFASFFLILTFHKNDIIFILEKNNFKIEKNHWILFFTKFIFKI